MAQKKVKTRIQNKYDFPQRWDQAGKNDFKPLPGELIVYDNPHHSRFKQTMVKIGRDSDENINELSFLGTQPMIYGEIRPTMHISDTCAFFCTPDETGYVEVRLSMGVGDDEEYLAGNPVTGFNKKQFIYVPFHSEENADRSILVNFIISGSPIESENRSQLNPSVVSANVYLEPSKCLTGDWTVLNTVSNGFYTHPSATIEEYEENSTDYSFLDFQYEVYLPSDKDDSGAFKFNSGLLVIELDLFRVDDEECFINVRNSMSFSVEV